LQTTAALVILDSAIRTLLVKKLLIIFAFLFGFAQAHAQFEKDDVIISLIGMQDFHTTPSFGTEVQYFVGDHISLNYRLLYSPGHFHAPGGLALSAVLLVSLAEFGGDLSILYAALIPEGVSFHARLTDNMSLSPYINPLGYDYLSSNRSSRMLFHETETEHFITINGGVRLNVFMGEWLIISPFAEYMSSYNQDLYGFRFGVTAGRLIR
jgi:hypothetical protein